ncbi:MAG: DUF1080 domain-containing protein [Tannerella sp.]|jgi:hypothetical protein|nr:DUF1080 domain-containing protein [Tannerella sp.]
MKKVFVFLTLCVCATYMLAQQATPQAAQQGQQQQVQPPRPPQWNPAATEWYTPVPPKVAPGRSAGQPPSDAIILFDGTNMDKWESSRAVTERGARPDPSPWKIENGTMVIVPRSGGIQTKEYFGDCQLHIEFKSPPAENHNGQNRGNSGIFLQNTYEVQVLDGDNNETYVNGMVGSIYKQSAPSVNAYTKNGEWQVYDIYWKAPKFDSNGLIEPAQITVVLNGIVIQNHFTLKGDTPYTGLPKYTPHGRLPLSLQDHGTAVAYRNIWIRNL